MIKTLLLCAVFALPASAQDATLVKIHGPVSRLVAGSKKFIPAKGGEGMVFGDTIRVGKGGIAQLALSDRGAILLREQTIMTLKGTAQRTELSVAFGEFLIGLRKKLGPGQSFKVRTSAAVAAVRGTLFWGKADKADKSTTYAGFGNTVAVRALGKTVIVEPGKTVTVAYGQAPADPVPSEIGLDYAQKFAIDGSLQGIDSLAETDKLEK